MNVIRTLCIVLSRRCVCARVPDTAVHRELSLLLISRSFLLVIGPKSITICGPGRRGFKVRSPKHGRRGVGNLASFVFDIAQHGVYVVWTLVAVSSCLLQCTRPVMPRERSTWVNIHRLEMFRRRVSRLRKLNRPIDRASSQSVLISPI